MSLRHPVYFYYRYVNDFVISIPSNYTDSVLTTFNCFHPRIQFSMEIGGHKLNFLDVILIRNHHTIELNWYHKSIFTGRYLNFLSHYSISQKRGIVLEWRCFLLSHPKYYLKNLNLLINVLLENDYLVKFIFDNIYNRLKSLVNKQTMKQKPINSATPTTKPS